MNHFVGPWRRQAGASFPSNVVPHAKPESELACAFAGRKFVAEYLKGECFKCQGCPLAPKESP